MGHRGGQGHAGAHRRGAARLPARRYRRDVSRGGLEGGARRRCRSTTMRRSSALAAAAAYEQVDGRITIDGHDVTRAIRTPEIDKAAASVARLPHVREVLVGQQRDLGARRRGGDGRPRHRHGGVSGRRPEVLHRRLAGRAGAAARGRSGAHRRPGEHRDRAERTGGARQVGLDARGRAARAWRRTRSTSTPRRCRSRWSSIA